MKQIFDWLREETDIYADEAGYYQKNRLVLTAGRVKRIINEAEAKWESEVCEWKVRDVVGVEAHEKIMYRHEVASWTYCPYCSKKIKITEVE